MNVTICLPPELTGYLRQFPQYQWEKCILLTLALGAKCVQQHSPGGASLEALIGCLGGEQREVKQASLRIPHQSPRTGEKAAVPALRKSHQPHTAASTVRRSKSARVESTKVTEPRTNPVYVKRLTAATDSLLAITSRFLADPLLTALSTSPH